MFYHRFYSRGLKILMAYLFVGLMFVSINVYSAFDAFSCVVKQAQFVSNDGLLVDQARHQYLVAQEFNVDKNTGAIVGAFTTDNIKKQPAIIDYGSKNQALRSSLHTIQKLR